MTTFYPQDGGIPSDLQLALHLAYRCVSTRGAFLWALRGNVPSRMVSALDGLIDAHAEAARILSPTSPLALEFRVWRHSTELVQLWTKGREYGSCHAGVVEEAGRMLDEAGTACGTLLRADRPRVRFEEGDLVDLRKRGGDLDAVQWAGVREHFGRLTKPFESLVAEITEERNRLLERLRDEQANVVVRGRQAPLPHSVAALPVGKGGQAEVGGEPVAGDRSAAKADAAGSRRKQGTVNQRMLEEFQNNPECIHWSQREWARRLNCSATSINDAPAWETIKAAVALQAAGRLDRRRRLAPPDE